MYDEREMIMYFIDQRIQVICDQLQLLRFGSRQDITGWKYKAGQYFRPEEADAGGPPWEDFDIHTMHWYARHGERPTPGDGRQTARGWKAPITGSAAT